MSLPLGLTNPYTDGTPPPAPPAPVPTEPELPGGDQNGSPSGPFFAATEDEVRRQMESQDNPPAPQTQTQTQTAGGFLSTAPGAQTTAQQPQGAAPQQAPGQAQTQAPGFQQQGPSVQDLRRELSNIGSEAEKMYYQLIAGGMPEPQARQNVTVAAQLYKADLEQKLLLTQLSGPMRDVTASDIARRHSIPGQVTITAQDLLGEPTPQAMEARARAIAEVRRDTRVQTRVQNRVDAAESSGSLTSGASTATRQMTPFELIRSGLKGRRN